VNLVEINGIDSQPFEAGLALALNGSSLQIMRDRAGIVPDQTALCENVGATAQAPNGAAHDGFRMSEAIAPYRSS